MKSISFVFVHALYRHYYTIKYFEQFVCVCPVNNDLIKVHLSGCDVMSSNVVFLCVSHISIESKPIQLLVNSGYISHNVHNLQSTDSSSIATAATAVCTHKYTSDYIIRYNAYIHRT